MITGAFCANFAVLKEEVTVDDDSFDYVFYSYGLRLYGNMPLIEPQEWKEVKKSGGFCNRDRYLHVLFRRSGKKIPGGDLWHFKVRQAAFFRESTSTLYSVMTRCSRTGRSPVKKNYRNIWKSWIFAGEGGTDFRPAFPILMS